MSGMWGADASELELAATQLSSAADRLDVIAGRVARLLASSPWNGRDADDMRRDWSQTLKPALGEAAGRLRGEAAGLRGNARAQTQASAATAAALGGAAATGGAALVGGAAVGVARDTDTLTPEARERLRRQALTMDEKYGQQFAGATAKLTAWAEEMAVGEHSDQEWDAFLRYRLAVQFAASTHANVEELLSVAASQLHASASSVSSLVEGFPGSDEARDALMTAITTGKSDELMKNWDSLMNSRLELVEADLRSADTIGRIEYSDAVRIHMGGENAQSELIRTKALAGEAFDFLRGTGTELDSNLRDGASKLAPPVGVALEISEFGGNVLAAGHEARVAVDALNAASYLATDSLDSSFALLTGGTHG